MKPGKQTRLARASEESFKPGQSNPDKAQPEACRTSQPQQQRNIPAPHGNRTDGRRCGE